MVFASDVRDAMEDEGSVASGFGKIYELESAMFWQDDKEELEALWGAKDLLSTENGGAWSKKMLRRYGTPKGIDMKKFEWVGNHVWLYYKGKHYDAELPEGSNNMWDLPWCKRELAIHKKNLK